MVSLPADVAEQLDALPARQSSAYVTEALRRRRISDDMRAVLRAAGHGEFTYDPNGTAQKLAARQVTSKAREAAIARVAKLLGRPADELRAELDRPSAAWRAGRSGARRRRAAGVRARSASRRGRTP